MKNQVIKVLSEEHGKEVIKYWQSLGVDTRHYDGSAINGYYGLFNGEFSSYNYARDSEVIELPKQSEQIIDLTNHTGVLMEVSPYNDFRNSSKRFVFEKDRNSFHAWDIAEKIEDIDFTSRTAWAYARPIQEETIVELTLEDISKGKGVGVPSHLIRIKK